MTAANQSFADDPVPFILGKGVSIETLSAGQKTDILRTAVLLSCSQFEFISMPFTQHLRERRLDGNLPRIKKPSRFRLKTECIEICNLTSEQIGSQEVLALTTGGEFLLWRLIYETDDSSIVLHSKTLEEIEVSRVNNALLERLFELTPDLFLRIVRGIRSALGAGVTRKEKELERLRTAYKQVEKIAGNLTH